MTIRSEDVAEFLESALFGGPEAEQLRQAVRELGNVAHQDQSAAAAKQVVSGIQADATTGRLEYRDFTQTDMPAWVRKGMLAAVAGWFTGESARCRHNPDPRKPQPVSAASWNPGLVVCSQCTYDVQLHRRRAETRCNGCGRVGGITPTMTTFGHFQWWFAACGECWSQFPFDDEPERSDSAPSP